MMTIKKTRWGNEIHWELTSDHPIDEIIAQDAQIIEGYHPGGYDFVGFATEQLKISKKFRATWRCYDNCE